MALQIALDPPLGGLFSTERLSPGNLRNTPRYQSIKKVKKYFCKNFGICYIWLVGVRVGLIPM